MLLRLTLTVLALFAVSQASIVEEVRTAIEQNNFTLAETEIRSYRTKNGDTSELIEAVSWVGRGALASHHLELAETYARQAETLAVGRVKKIPLDSDESLALALGAAFEVQSQVLAQRGQRDRAIALLKRAIQNYGNTSIHARLQKNLNLISLVGAPAPALHADRYIGKPAKLALTGSPTLLFFWAHWCGDCKYQGPIIARLRSEFGAQGLRVIAPTQLYGYAARGEEASPAAELSWIDLVRQRFYPSLGDVPMPVSKATFDTYGVSTTPTLALVNGKGIVTLYHPGLMSYAELRAAIDQTLAKSIARD